MRYPELRRESAVKGRQRIEGQYLWPGIARSIEKIYRQVLGWECAENLTAESFGGLSPEPEAASDSGVEPVSKIA
jgi:hypothetical protein